MNWSFEGMSRRVLLCSKLIGSTCSIPLPPPPPLLPGLLDTDLISLLPFPLAFLDMDHFFYPHFPSSSLPFSIPLPHFCVWTFGQYLLSSSVSRALDASPRTPSFRSFLCPHISRADLRFSRTITRVWRRPPGWIVAVRRRAVLVFLPLLPLDPSSAASASFPFFLFSSAVLD